MLQLGVLNDNVAANRVYVRADGKVGIGVASPVAALDVNGGVRIGDQATCTNGTHNGTLRYSGGALEICGTTGWVAVGTGGGGGTAPAFRAFRSAAYTSPSVNFKFDYDAEVYDTTSSFDLANDQFVAPTTGKYLFTAVVAPGTAGALAPWLSVNGANVAWGNFENASVGNHRILTTVVSLNSGDVVQLWISNNGGVTSWNPGQNYASFTGTMLNYGGSGGGSGTVSGTTGKLAKFTSATAVGDSVLTESSGNVGIGTASPSAKLTVSSGGTKSDLTQYEPFRITSTDVANPFGLTFYVAGNATAGDRYAGIQATEVGVASNNLTLNQYGGNVGIGTTSPGELLHVSSGTATARIKIDGNPNATLALANQNASRWAIANSELTGSLSVFAQQSGNTEVFTIKQGGNVGIGATAPAASAKLEVASTDPKDLPPRMTTVQRDAVSSPAEGLVIYNSTTKALEFFNGTTWAVPTATPYLVNNGSFRIWSNGIVASSCNKYLNPDAGFSYSGATGDGVYLIDPDGAGPISAVNVYCDMTTDGGGWDSGSQKQWCEQCR